MSFKRKSLLFLAFVGFHDYIIMAISLIIELLLGVIEQAFIGAPHWLDWVPTFIGTLIFAGITWRSLHIARKAYEKADSNAQSTIIQMITANEKAQEAIEFAAEQAEKQDNIRLRDRVIEEMSSIIAAISSRSPLQDNEAYKNKKYDEIVADYGYLFTTIKEKLTFEVYFSVTANYILSISLVAMYKAIDSSNKTVDDEAASIFSNFDSKVTGVCLTIVKMSTKDFIDRYACEKKSHENYNMLSAEQEKIYKNLPVEELARIYDRAKASIYHFKPYDYAKDPVFTSSQPKETS